jgi:hypothetical protein
MAKAGTTARIWTTPKRSSSSGKPSMVKTSSMNKSKKRSYKAYRGQGK